MKIAKIVKLTNVALLFALTLGVIFAQSVAPQAVHAQPLSTFAASLGDKCTLPNGDTNGVMVKYSGMDAYTCCPPGTNNISCLYGKYLNPLIELLSAAVGVAVVIGIVFGAVEYITSNGDPQRAASGRKRIINSLIALVSFLLLYAFLQFIVPGGLMHG